MSLPRQVPAGSPRSYSDVSNLLARDSIRQDLQNLEDDTGDAELVFFLANHAWIEKSLPLGAKRWISGKLELVRTACRTGDPSGLAELDQRVHRDIVTQQSLTTGSVELF